MVRLHIHFQKSEVFQSEVEIKDTVFGTFEKIFNILAKLTLITDISNNYIMAAMNNLFNIELRPLSLYEKLKLPGITYSSFSLECIPIKSSITTPDHKTLIYAICKSFRKCNKILLNWTKYIKLKRIPELKVVKKAVVGAHSRVAMIFLT